MILATPVYSLGAAPPTPPAPVNTTADKIGDLQKLLAGWGAVDRQGEAPKATGKLDSSTVEAFNYFQERRDRPPITRNEILIDLDRAITIVADAYLAKKNAEFKAGLHLKGLGAAESPEEAAARAAALKRIAEVKAADKKAPPPKGLSQKDKITLLQKALVRAGAKDTKGRPVAVDGVMGANTLAAFNGLQEAFGRTKLTQAQLLAQLDDAITKIGQKATPQSTQATVSSMDNKTTASAKTLKEPTGVVGGFACKGGVCTGTTEQSRSKAIQLQQALNAFPPNLVRQYPGGKLLSVDGKIGANTVAAVRIALRAWAARVNEKLSESELAGYNPETIAANLDPLLLKLPGEATLQTKAAAQIASKAPGVMPATSSYTLTSKGNAIGNRRFRCYAMALQVQLNRFGQRIGVDGTIGPNTLASVNKVLSTSMTITSISDQIEPLVDRVQKLADSKKYPAPSPAIAGASITKCLQETSQPGTDTRIPAEVVEAKADAKQPVQHAGPPTVEPAPDPTPTPPHEQPVPSPPNPSPPNKTFVDPTAPPPSTESDWSLGGIQYTVRPDGTVVAGSGPDAARFGQVVSDLQTQLGRLGSPVAMTAILDAATTAAFNAVVTPELLDTTGGRMAPYRTVDLAKNLESVDAAARQLADRKVAAAKAQVTTPQPPVAVPPQARAATVPYERAPPPGGEIGPDQAQGLYEQALASGLHPATAQDIVAQQQAAGATFDQAQAGVQQAAQEAAPPASEGKPFPWKLVAIGGAGVVGVGLATLAVYKLGGKGRVAPAAPRPAPAVTAPAAPPRIAGRW